LGSFAKSNRQAALFELKDAKTGPFHKALFLFPTGQSLVSAVSDMAAQLSTDKRFQKELAELEIMCGRLALCTISFEAAGDAGASCCLKQQGTWADCRKRLANIIANSSESFREDSKETIQTVTNKLACVSKQLTACVLDRYATVVDTEMGKLLAMTVTDISDSDFDACTQALEGAVVDLHQTPLPLVGSEEEQKAYASSIDRLRSFAKALRGAIAWLQKPDVLDMKGAQDFLDTSAQVFALLNVQTSGNVGPGERRAPGLVKFHGTVARQVVKVCKERLLDLLSSSQPFIVELTKFLCPGQFKVEPKAKTSDKDSDSDKTGMVKQLASKVFQQHLVGDLAVDGEDGIIATVLALACLALLPNALYHNP
jgi:hypothetical protein